MQESVGGTIPSTGMCQPGRLGPALLVVTLVHNNTKNSTTSYAPNQLLIGQEPSATPEHTETLDNPLAEKQVEQLH